MDVNAVGAKKRTRARVQGGALCAALGNNADCTARMKCAQLT